MSGRRTLSLPSHLSQERPSSRSMPRWRAGGLAVATLLLLVLVTGCGNQATPTAEPAPTEAQDATSTPPVSSTSTTGVGGNQPASTETAAPELTLGELTDRINAAWRDLTHFREINASTASARSAIGSPTAPSPVGERASRSVREVTLPDRARYVAEENGQLVFEMVVIGEQVYARGTVAALLDPSAANGEWIVTDLLTVANNPMLGDAAARQLATLAAPAYVVPERLRPQTVRLLGETPVDGRTCTLYGAADTTPTGARIDFTFAVDQENRLCFVETKTFGISSRYSVEELDASFVIEAPSGARPLATPLATPRPDSTPLARSTPFATP